MKKRRLLSLIMSMVICIVVCSCEKDHVKNTGTTTAKLVKIDGKYYIQLDDGLEKDNASDNSCEIARHIYYSSMDEFYSKVTESDFSEDDIDAMHQFDSDDIGIIVCNLDNLYQMVSPDDTIIERISWRGNEYITYWNSTYVKLGVAFMYESEERFEEEMQSFLPDDYFDDENIKVFDYAENQGDDYVSKKWMYNENTGAAKFKRKIEMYEYYKNGVYNKVILKYTIEKTKGYYEKSYSETIPYEVNVFSKGDGFYCYNIMHNIESSLDSDWLMSFGIEPYTPE